MALPGRLQHASERFSSFNKCERLRCVLLACMEQKQLSGHCDDTGRLLQQKKGFHRKLLAVGAFGNVGTFGAEARERKRSRCQTA
ncbi:uncharacterized protein V6R79_004583 [Siganus canaliculatus]